MLAIVHGVLSVLTPWYGKDEYIDIKKYINVTAFSFYIVYPLAARNVVVNNLR